MFGKLKEKLKNWAKNLAESKKEDLDKEPKKEVLDVESQEEKIDELAQKIEEDEKQLEELKKEKKKEKKVVKKQEEGKTREIDIPTRFDSAKQKFEPDIDKILEIKEDLEEREKGLEKKEEEKIKAIEKAEKEEKIESEKPSFFSRIKSKITKVKISEKEFDVYEEELQELLLENNVALSVAERIIKELKQEIVGKELLKKEIEEEIKDIFKDIIRRILINPFNVLERIKEKKSKNSNEPYVILFCGINGTGKTTTIAKIADFFKRNGFSCALAAADTFRAASIEQIQKHGEKLGIKVVSHDYGSDPASVGFDAIQYAKKNRIDVVLIDTAGRMHTDKNLLREIEKISKVNKPDIKIFVGESITGNDVIEQAKSFDWHIGIDGIVLTKADIDEKGGTALSVGYVLKKPILFLGTGQEYDKIEPFDKEKFIEKLGL